MSEDDSEKDIDEEISEKKRAKEEKVKEKVEKKEPKKLLLKWNEETGHFDPIESDSEMDAGIFIEYNEEAKKWRYFYIEGASLIARRTALRSANGIAKTGFVHPKTNIRYGVECKLEEDKSPYEDMPESLRKAQRAWYVKERKK